MTGRTTVYAPLINFSWAGNQVRIVDNIEISDAPRPQELAGMYSELTEVDREIANESRHWLLFTRKVDSTLSANEISNLVLLALWIVNPSSTQIRMRFEIGEHGHTTSRHLDRFQPIKSEQYVGFSDNHLQQAGQLYEVLREVRLAEGRLYHGLHLTLTGCWSKAWTTALICHAAAAEALLTYSQQQQITRKLATAYENGSRYSELFGWLSVPIQS